MPEEIAKRYHTTLLTAYNVRGMMKIKKGEMRR